MSKCAHTIRVFSLASFILFAGAMFWVDAAYCDDGLSTEALKSGDVSSTLKASSDSYDISEATISFIPTQYIDESSAVPVYVKPTVKLNGVTLRGVYEYEDSYSYDSDYDYDEADYWVTYSNNSQPGKAKAIISGLDPYYGTKEVEYSIVGKLSRETTKCYDVLIDENSLEDSDIKLSNYDYDYYSNPIDNCDYYCIIKIKNYTGSAITVNPTMVFVFTVSDENSFEGDVEVANLIRDKDYTLSFSNNVDVGTATMSVKGIGNYTGSFTKTFKIRGDLSKASISGIPNQSYTGSALKPEPEISYAGKVLKLGTDYTLKYKNNKKAGTATVTATGKGSYTGSISAKFKIYKQSISKAKFTTIKQRVYRGEALCPEPSIILNGKSLTYNEDYTLTYSGNEKPGMATVTAIGKGKYKGRASAKFRIVGLLSKAHAEGMNDLPYTGKAITPKPSIKDGYSPALRLELGKDYKLSYKNNKKVGTAMFVATGIGNYSGKLEGAFKIYHPMKKARVSSIEKQTYTGKPITPKPKVTYGGKRLKLGRDYLLAYENNVDVGTAEVTVEGKGKYGGSVSAQFRIAKLPMKKARVLKIPDQTQKYYGDRVKPKPVVKYGKKTLKFKKDYVLSYKKNHRFGTALVVIKGAGQYEGELEKPFRIVGNIGKAKAASLPVEISTGSAIEPKPKWVSLNGVNLKEGRDYSLSYENNVNEGMASVIVSGKGNLFRGQKRLAFKIIQRGEGHTVSLDEFNRIKLGLTYSQVCAVIGGKGKLSNSYEGYETKYESYTWDGDRDYSSVSVSFKDGKVYSKHQFGL